MTPEHLTTKDEEGTTSPTLTSTLETLSLVQIGTWDILIYHTLMLLLLLTLPLLLMLLHLALLDPLSKLKPFNSNSLVRRKKIAS